MKSFFYCLLLLAFPAQAALVIAICGHSERTCDGRDEALNSTFGKPNISVAPGASGSQIDVINGSEAERVPTTSNASLQPVAPSAPATAALSTWYQVGADTCALGYVGDVHYQTKAEACTVMGEGSLKSQNANKGYSCSSPDPWYTGAVSTVNGSGNCDIVLSVAAWTGAGPRTFPNNPLDPTTGCPSGYTLQNSSCVLSDARAVTADQKKDFSRSGTTLAAASANDADNSIFLDNESIGKIVAASYQRSGYSPSGNPAHVEIKPLSAGGSTVIYSESYNGQVKQTIYNIDAGGSVGSFSSGSAAGSLSPNVAEGTASVSSPAGVSAPGSGGGTSSGLSASTFPSDYSKSGEAAAAAKSITDKLAETSTPSSDPVLPGDAAYTGFGSTFSPLTAWSVPGHTSTCPTSSFTAPWGASYTFSSHCALITSNWSALQTAMTVVWTIAALFIVLRA